MTKIDSKIRQFLLNIDKNPDGDKTLEYVRQTVRQRCKNDLWFFNHYVIGFKDIDTELHHDMCDKFQAKIDYPYTMWFAPRGHLKTSVWTIGGNLFRLIRNPDQRIVIGNAKLENAEDILKDIRVIVETNEIFRWAFPEYCRDLVSDAKGRRCKWEMRRLDFPCSIYAGRKEGNIEIIAVEASLVSKHYDVLDFDDLVNELNTATRLYRNKIDMWMKNVLQLRHSPATSQICIKGTFWHEDDWYNRKIREEKKYRRELRESGVKIIPRWHVYIRKVVEQAKDGEKGLDIVGKRNVLPIWPQRFSPIIIEETKQENGSYVFGCQYLLEPVSSEDQIFRLKDIQIIPFFDIPDKVANFMAVDLAASDKEESDYTAIVVASFDYLGKMYVRQVVRKKMLPREAFTYVEELTNKWGVQRVGIESVAFQTIVLKYQQEIWFKKDINIPWIELKRTTATKFKRILGMQPIVERGDFYIEEGIQNLDAVIGEMTSMTMDHLPPFDDVLDALSDLHQISYESPKIMEETPKKDTMEAFYGNPFFDFTERESMFHTSRRADPLTLGMY